jgi:hypothetical protein
VISLGLTGRFFWRLALQDAANRRSGEESRAKRFIKRKGIGDFEDAACGEILARDAPYAPDNYTGCLAASTIEVLIPVGPSRKRA